MISCSFLVLTKLTVLSYVLNQVTVHLMLREGVRRTFPKVVSCYLCVALWTSMCTVQWDRKPYWKVLQLLGSHLHSVVFSAVPWPLFARVWLISLCTARHQEPRSWGRAAAKDVWQTLRSPPDDRSDSTISPRWLSSVFRAFREFLAISAELQKKLRVRWRVFFNVKYAVY